MKIKTKLLIYFTILLAFSLSAATVAYLFMRALPKSAQNLENSHDRVDFVARLQLAIERSLMPPNDFLTHGDLQERKNFETLNAQVKTMFTKAIDMGYTVDELRILDSVKAQYNEVEKIALHILSLKYPRLEVQNVSDTNNVASMMEKMDAIAEDAIERLDHLNTRLLNIEEINLHKLNRLFYYAEDTTIASLLFITFFGIGLCFVCVRTFTNPLDRVFGGVRHFTNGNFSRRIDIESPDEFQQLSTALNQMSHNIQTAQTRLEESTRVWEDTFDSITDAVSIHDTNCNIINVNEAYMRMFNNGKEELIGKKCYEVIHHAKGNIKNCPSIKALEKKTPQISVIEDEQLHVHLQVAAYPMKNNAGDYVGVVHLIRDITEKKKLEEELSAYRTDLEHRVNERTVEVNELLIGAVKAMAIAIDKKSPWTADHSTRVSRYATGIAQALNKDDEFVEKVRIASLLHDIGKLGVPDALLNSTEFLDEERLSIIKNHTVIGADIIKNVKHFGYAVSGILQHHEFFNYGNPQSGLHGAEIPLTARIIAVADAYDAMTSERPYRKKLSHEESIAELKKCEGTQFDPIVVDAFLNSLNT